MITPITFRFFFNEYRVFIVSKTTVTELISKENIQKHSSNKCKIW